MDKPQAQPGSIADQQRYELFVRNLLEHEPRVRAFLRGLLPSWQDAAEVTQEASLVAWRKFSDFEEGTSFGGWFLTIARYEAMAYRRRQARSPLVFSDAVWDLLAEETTEAEEEQVRHRQLESCLDTLDSRQRELLMKVYSSGVVMREVAKQYGKSEQAFYKVVQRLRASLLKCISKAKAMEGCDV
ncbi:RNA polymerase sigma factor [Planctomycetes bacterium MalM25]|nr:RNA polymerase sigma factor [Planctomycetes bacterium MalM25]